MLAKPFIKWVGGKSQLIPQLEQHYSELLLSDKVDKYTEPFIGGGALFFDIVQKFNISKSYISDINKDLILVYKTVQQKSIKLIEELDKLQLEYNSLLDIEQQKTFFLSIREDFNINREYEIESVISDCLIYRAAQFIFLNKSCFNGLFRVNSKGEFNVPFGKHVKLNLYDSKNIELCSKVLKNTVIEHVSYESSIDFIDNKTFVYFDPPYKPISTTSSFNTYTKEKFLDENQVKLFEYYRFLSDNKKCFVMLSNSDPKNNSDDDFFDVMFKDFNIVRVDASRSINCVGEKRGKIKEIIIKNY